MTVTRAVPFHAPARTLRLAAVDDPEFARVLRIGDPAPALDGALTFLPSASLSATEWLQTWQGWQADLFAPTLIPLLINITAQAAQGRAREILSLDAELDAALEPDSRLRSAAAGQRLLARLEGAQGDRWLGKLQAASAEGRFAAHFLTIYACQGARFHLPSRSLPVGYAYWEWCTAMTTFPLARGQSSEFSAVAPALRQLVETQSLSSDLADARSVFRVS